MQKKDILLSLKEVPWVNLGSLVHLTNWQRSSVHGLPVLHSSEAGEAPGITLHLLPKKTKTTTRKNHIFSWFPSYWKPMALLSESNLLPLKRRQLKFPEYSPHVVKDLSTLSPNVSQQDWQSLQGSSRLHIVLNYIHFYIFITYMFYIHVLFTLYIY